MVEVHAEDMRHQRVVQRIVNRVIKRGYKPGDIRISGSQNPDLEAWCKKKGVIFNKRQKVDIISPDWFDD